MAMTARLIYSPKYDLTLYGLERLHPFDGRKYSRAWRRVTASLGERALALLEAPDGPVSDERLRRVHSQAYLDTLARSSEVIGRWNSPCSGCCPIRC